MMYLGRDAIGVNHPLYTDVQITGTSITEDGVANIPVATSTTLGVVKASTYGVAMGVSGLTGSLVTYPARSENIKSAAYDNYCYYRPITPYNQHESVFYGLAKVAGTDLANETVTLGTYPQATKTAIQTMIGVELGATIVQTISGTTPTIECEPNTRYVCGEVASLTIVPSSEGVSDVMFTSGSTATVLTLPNTVKFPAWTDVTALKPNTTYEIMITDGVYGGVMEWPT